MLLLDWSHMLCDGMAVAMQRIVLPRHVILEMDWLQMLFDGVAFSMQKIVLPRNVILELDWLQMLCDAVAVSMQRIVLLRHVILELDWLQLLCDGVAVSVLRIVLRRHVALELVSSVMCKVLPVAQRLCLHLLDRLEGPVGKQFKAMQNTFSYLSFLVFLWLPWLLAWGVLAVFRHARTRRILLSVKFYGRARAGVLTAHPHQQVWYAADWRAFNRPVP